MLGPYIFDPYFLVRIDPDASSPRPQRAIWKSQHFCVSENPRLDDHKVPDNKKAGEAVIRNQLDGDRGHYSVLTHAFVKLEFFGFPHSVIAQMTRHQDSDPLVQSNRYTGYRFCEVAEGKRSVEETFYLRPPGQYRDRDGSFYVYTEAERLDDIEFCKLGCDRYRAKVLAGCPYEMARGHTIVYDFRQEFCLAGTIEACWHWLDQRTKADAQLEVQTLAAMAFKELSEWSPELFGWYAEKRYGKAKLAP